MKEIEISIDGRPAWHGLVRPVEPTTSHTGGPDAFPDPEAGSLAGDTPSDVMWDSATQGTDPVAAAAMDADIDAALIDTKFFFDRALERARNLGDDHGHNAAQSRVEIIGVVAAQALLNGIQHGESVIDILPEPDLSGEWADTFSSHDLFIECAWEDDASPEERGVLVEALSLDAFTEVCDAYEESFRGAVGTEVMRRCQELIDESWEQNPVIDDEDIAALFELIPGAKDALQGIDIHNTSHLWDAVVLSMQGQGELVRSEVRARVATAIRAIEYGERLDAVALADEDKTCCTVHEAGACFVGCPDAYDPFVNPEDDDPEIQAQKAALIDHQAIQQALQQTAEKAAADARVPYAKKIRALEDEMESIREDLRSENADNLQLIQERDCAREDLRAALEAGRAVSKLANNREREISELRERLGETMLERDTAYDQQTTLNRMHQDRAAALRAAANARDSALGALEAMVVQYLGTGVKQDYVDFHGTMVPHFSHLFMTAGEAATEILSELLPETWRNVGDGVALIGESDWYFPKQS